MLPDDDLRTYPKWLPAQKRYSGHNIGPDFFIPMARKWLDLQGANPDKLLFDSNSGRKALGKWCDEFGIKYHESFEIHGDLWRTWKRHYQHGLQKDPCFERRTQSLDPSECCAALRKFARAIGRGRTVREDPKQFDMDQIGKLLCANLRAMGKGAEVASILDK
jgi:hypothetical protein